MGNLILNKMPLPVLAPRLKYYKNGVFFWAKWVSRAVDEHNFEKFFFERRIWFNQFYWQRQSLLYEMYTVAPEIANTIGIYPKVDSSTGFPVHNPYEMFRDFQENSINSDGWFAMFIVFGGTMAILNAMYSYFLPFYWIQGNIRNEEETRLRMRDALATCCAEESIGNQFLELAYTP